MVVAESGLVPKNAETVAKLARVTGIEVAELRDAWRRIQEHGYSPPRYVVADAPTDAPKSANAPWTPRRKKIHPTRRCVGCGEEKRLSAFRPKDRTGAGPARCKACLETIRQDSLRAFRRQLNVSEDAIAVELTDGDGCIGHPCPKCGKPLEVGQVAVGTGLRHEACR